MPLDTISTYSQTLLRQDGRRWNELRRITASIQTQPSSDGSSLLTMGNTMVVCTVTGPREGYVSITSTLLHEHTRSCYGITSLLTTKYPTLTSLAAVANETPPPPSSKPSSTSRPSVKWTATDEAAQTSGSRNFSLPFLQPSNLTSSPISIPGLRYRSLCMCSVLMARCSQHVSTLLVWLSLMLECRCQVFSRRRHVGVLCRLTMTGKRSLVWI